MSFDEGITISILIESSVHIIRTYNVPLLIYQNIDPIGIGMDCPVVSNWFSIVHFTLFSRQ